MYKRGDARLIASDADYLNAAAERLSGPGDLATEVPLYLAGSDDSSDYWSRQIGIDGVHASGERA